MSNVISKGNLSAFQRWEMASFGEERPAQIAEQNTAAINAEKLSRIEHAKLREAAQTEGYATGYKEGYASGYQEGQESGYAEGQARIQQELALLIDLREQFENQLRHADEAIGHDLIALALDLSKAIVKTSLEVDPELIIPIVRDSIEHLPSSQQSACLWLHPDDANIIKEHMGEELDKSGWRIATDPHMTRGGCKLDTKQNLVDATLMTRWERLTKALKAGQALE
jgi:flagellar assembly protein FliH